MIAKNNNTVEEIKKYSKAEIQLVIDKNLCEKSFYHFFKKCTKNVYKNISWTYPPFYEYICNRLQWYAENYIAGNKAFKDIILSLPFRSGKSTLLECYRSWLWTKSLNIDILSIAATSQLAIKSNRNIKRIIESNWYQSMWKVDFAKDSRAKGSYNNQMNASMIAIGVKASGVGKDASILCIDDPNDPAESVSETAIKEVIRRFQDTLYSRLNEPSRGYRIICQQRVNASDLTGWCLEKFPNSFENICLPVKWNKFATPELRYLYDEEGFLWQERYGEKQLRDYEEKMTPSAVASQLYMSPASLSGEIILRIWLPSIKQSEFQQIIKGKIFLFIDTAYTSNDKNDATAFFVCCVNNGKLYVIKAYEKWLEFYECIEEIKELIISYGVSKCYIENKSTGLSVQQELKRQLRGKTVILGVSPGSKSKIERARSIQPYLQNGKVCCVSDTWVNNFVDQCANFPYGKDNMVDCLVYAVGTLIAGKHASENQPTNNNRGMFGESDFEDLYK